MQGNKIVIAQEVKQLYIVSWMYPAGLRIMVVDVSKITVGTSLYYAWMSGPFNYNVYVTSLSTCK